MTKIKWDAMDETEKNALVAKMVMKWTLCSVSDPDGVVNCGDLFDNWVDADGGGMYEPRDFLPTTDRNACALVLDEIGKRELEEPYFGCLMDALFGVDCWHFGFDDDLMALMSVHNVDPGTACFCAVKAVEDK